MISAAREPGYRPSPEEDPLNSWMWKCRIEGAPDGLLAGKTVSYKDHIAVAGIPMSFGSFALEGFIPDFDATVVNRVLKEGGTIIGKNVMNGLSGGFGVGGAIGDYGRPLNPHNHDHVTGGSSSGSAAAWPPARWTFLSAATRADPSASCGFLRHRWAQAYVRIVVALWDRVRLGPEHRSHWSDDPYRGGCGGYTPGHRGLRPLRSPPDTRRPHQH